MDSIAMLTKACELMGRQVEAAGSVGEAQTACSEWNASELVNHMVASLTVGKAMLTGEAPPYDPTEPPQVVGSDPVADYKRAADALIDAYNVEGALERTVQGPGGPVSGSQFLFFPLLDVYVHSWDLSQATGLEGEYPAEITAAVMEYAQMAFSGDRPPPIGPAVTASENASEIEKLVAFLGRKP